MISNARLIGSVARFAIISVTAFFLAACGSSSGDPSAASSSAAPSNSNPGSGATSASSPMPSAPVAGTGAGGTAQQSGSVAVLAPSCSATSGALKLKVKLTRASGISPLLVFFDATGTTDSSITANTTAFQDVTYTWDFGDSGASGSGVWKYGSNTGKNSMNAATGGIAAHLYITSGGDSPYTAKVTATDGTDTASCQMVLTAYDPSGANGFRGSATTCVAASQTPVAGKDGCPAGAGVLRSTSFVTALSGSQSGKRVLFNCGDTFTGNYAVVTGQKFSVGAYGSCVGSTNRRPILSDTGSSGEISLGSGSSADFDGRFSDLDLEGNGHGGTAFQNSSSTYPYQIVLNNILSNGNKATFYDYNASQYGLFNVVMIGWDRSRCLH